MHMVKKAPAWVRAALACALSAVLALALMPASALALGGSGDAGGSAGDAGLVGEASGEAEEDYVPSEEEILADAAAFAAVRPLAASGGEVSCGNGWTLAYDVGDGGVVITGVAA